MKKILFTMLLCLAVLLCSVPMTALAASDISTVNLSVTVPFHGANPEKPVADTDKVSIYAYEWKENGNTLSSFDKFEGDKTYTLKVRLTTLDRFSGNVSVKVNNLPATVLGVEYNNTHVIFEKDFYVSPVGYKLSFDPGLGSGTMAPMTGKTAYTLPQCSFTPPSGKEFKCWRVGDTNDLYEAGETIILRENTTVRALWVEPSGKTRIYDVAATSNISGIAVLYGQLKMPQITITKGAPAYITNSSSNLRWQKKVGDKWETQDSGRFTPGEWRISTQVRIDGDNAKQYELGNPTALTVDGVKWTMDNNGVPNVHHDYSMIFAYSPSFIIKDNPNVSPPQPITAVDVGITGYKLGATPKNAKVTCNNKNISISDVIFAVLEDTNNDGIPDKFDTAGEKFKAGCQYAAIFTLKANSGYDLSALGFNSVTCASGQVMGSYDSDEDKYQGACLLNPFDTCNVAFVAGGGKGTMAGVTVEKGAYTLPQNGFTAPTGKQFKAWNVGGKATAPGSKITVTANITVTALWEDIPAGHICKMKAVAKVAPTCTEDGKEAYFRCEGCGRFCEDAAAKKEIADLSTWGVLKKLGHADQNKDGKCDACGFEMNSSDVPITIPTIPVTPAVSQTPTRPADTTGPTAQPTEPSVSVNSDRQDPPDTDWIWIVAVVLCVAAALAVTIIILKKKAGKNQ